MIYKQIYNSKLNFIPIKLKLLIVFSQTNSNNKLNQVQKKLNQVVRANSAKNYGTRNLIVTV